jgi:hypothetical protein
MSMPPAAPFSTSTLLLATANDMLFPKTRTGFTQQYEEKQGIKTIMIGSHPVCQGN